MKREIKLILDGEERYLSHIRSEEQYDIGKKDLCTLEIPRQGISPEDIEEGRDRAELRIGGEVWFGGVIEDASRNGSILELTVESNERYAERAKPTSSVDEYNNIADADIIRDAIADVPELEAGAIETTNQSVSMMYSHASQAYKMRKAEGVSPGLLRFNPDHTVDYGKLGRNKSHITLSPRRGNVISEPDLERKSSYDRVTHLRMLGAGEGPHQVQADAVASDYEAGEPQIWKTYADKSITDKGTLKDKADHYVDELRTNLIEATLDVKGVECAIGDLFRVYLPERNVDEILEVVEHRRIIDTDGIRHAIVASNHRDTREKPEEKNRADVDNYNQAIEGNSVPINTSGGRQPVDPENPYELQLYYPSEVEYEHRLNVRVVGLPYRAYSAGSIDNSDFESGVADDSGLVTTSLPQGNWTTLGDQFTVRDDIGTSTLYALAHFYVPDFGESHTWGEVSFRYLRNGGEATIPSTENKADDSYQYRLHDGGNSVVMFADPVDVAGDTIEIQARLGKGSETGVTIDSNVMLMTAGKHTHDPDPGIIEGFGDDERTNHFPSDCQVRVNDEPVGGTLGGDANRRWSDSVDVRGKLNEGEINRIEVESESLGHLQCYVEGDLYRQIRSRG